MADPETPPKTLSDTAKAYLKESLRDARLSRTDFDAKNFPSSELAEGGPTTDIFHGTVEIALDGQSNRQKRGDDNIKIRADVFPYQREGKKAPSEQELDTILAIVEDGKIDPKELQELKDRYKKGNDGLGRITDDTAAIVCQNAYVGVNIEFKSGITILGNMPTQTTPTTGAGTQPSKAK